MTEVLYNPKIKPEHLARKAVVSSGSLAKNKYGKTKRVNTCSMP
jgi:hypothetical protein